jgi:hypothetical protein
MLFSVEEGLDLMTGGRVGVRTDSFEETREPAQQPVPVTAAVEGPGCAGTTEGDWLRCMRWRMSNAAGPLTSEDTPAAYSPVRTDHAVHAAAFPKINQYVAADSPSS